MSTSRRKFLKAGMVAALFAAVPLKNAWGQSWKDRDGNPVPPDVDPLSNYTKATFKQYLNSIFQLRTASGFVAVTLLQVRDMPAAKDGECFALLFRGGGGTALRQDTYTVNHAALGTFQLFLVPAGADNNGAQGYVATINRLSFKDALAPAPKGSATTKREGSIKTAEAPAPAVTPAPPSVAPTNSSPAQPTQTTTPATTTPTKRTKPARKRKPSWRRNDGMRD